MKKVIISAIASLALIFANPSVAGKIKTGSGSETGNYYSMVSDVQSLCLTDEILDEVTITDHTMEVFVSGGSVANLDGMNTKQFNSGIVQEDVLRLYSKFLMPKKVNEKRYKVVSPLHIEPFNLLIPKGYKPKGKKKGFFDKIFGDDDKPVRLDINLLKGQVVSAWGGSMVSAQALSRYLQLDFAVKEISKGDQGNVPILVVEGFPSTVVQSYLDSGKYNLVSIDYNSVRDRAEFYVPHKLSYTVSGKVVNVETIGTRALLIGKASRKAKRNLPMQELATCIEENLIDLEDGDDTNSNWSEVAEFIADENVVDWDYFELIEE